MAKQQKTTFDQDVQCEFSGVSLGEEVHRIGFRIDRDNLNIEEADEVFSGKQLECVLNVFPKKSNGVPPDLKKGQKQIKGTEDAFPEPQAETSIEGTFDSKRFSVNAKKISGSLSIPSGAGIHANDLANFVKRSGRMRLRIVGEVADDPEEGEDDK